MEISVRNTKLMTNSANGIQREIKVTGQNPSTVTSFKYLGAVVSNDGSKRCAPLSFPYFCMPVNHGP